MISITPAMREAVGEALGAPVVVIDEATQKTYFLVDAERNAEFMCEWLRHAIQLGIDDHAAGRVVEWDPEALKARGRAALRERGITHVFQQWLSREFETGLESVDAGRVAPLDMEQIKARGRELLEQQPSQS